MRLRRSESRRYPGTNVRVRDRRSDEAKAGLAVALGGDRTERTQRDPRFALELLRSPPSPRAGPARVVRDADRPRHRSRSSEAEPLERLPVAAPAWPHLHDELQEHGMPDEGLDLGASPCPDLADRRAALPDQDALLRLGLHEH